MTHPPNWAIVITYRLHFIATVMWVRNLSAIAFLLLPAMKRPLEPNAQLALIEAIQKRFEPLAWFSLSLLVLTGLFQMSVNPHYDGFLATSTQWSLAILAKHLLGMLVIVATAIQTWVSPPPCTAPLSDQKKRTIHKNWNLCAAAKRDSYKSTSFWEYSSSPRRLSQERHKILVKVESFRKDNRPNGQPASFSGAGCFCFRQPNPLSYRKVHFAIAHQNNFNKWQDALRLRRG